jgi:hypothetical protein
MFNLPDQCLDFVSGRSFLEMKTAVIAGTHCYSFGGRVDLSEHFAMLRSEFAGRTELEFYHAMLVVLLRRKIETEINRERFFAIWRIEQDFLVNNLDSRWLVSAADTIIDHGQSEVDRAFALAATVFMNTLKLYETERHASDWASVPYRPISSRVALFDGMSAFMIGQGDMISNLYARARETCDSGGVGAMIFLELLGRANKHDTVFLRFRNAHENARTLW